MNVIRFPSIQKVQRGFAYGGKTYVNMEYVVKSIVGRGTGTGCLFGTKARPNCAVNDSRCCCAARQTCGHARGECRDSVPKVILVPRIRTNVVHASPI